MWEVASAAALAGSSRRIGPWRGWRLVILVDFAGGSTSVPLLPLDPAAGLPPLAWPRRFGRRFVHTIRPSLRWREWTPSQVLLEM